MSMCKRAFCASWACLWPHIPMLAPLGCGTSQCHLQDIPLSGTKVVTRRTVKLDSAMCDSQLAACLTDQLVTGAQCLTP